MDTDRIVYIGGGYVGLTGALHMAKAGVETTIYDLDSKAIEDINNGTPKGEEFLKYLGSDVVHFVDCGLLTATTDWDEVKNNNIFIIAVPSEKDGEPYEEIVLSVVKKILIQPRREAPTIIIESTLSPGTGNKILEYARALNLEVGKDFFLAVCPRKDWFPDPSKNVATLPRVVGGVTDVCSQKVLGILGKVSKDIHITKHDTAELTKALENAFLHVPCMFLHELALARPDLDVAEAARLAGLHWRLPTYHLSFGTGGRCVPLGTKYLTKATEGGIGKLKIGEAATEADRRFRESIATILHLKYNEKAQKNQARGIVILGLGYRPDFKDTGLSSGLAVANILDSLGTHMFVHDSLFTEKEIRDQFVLRPLPSSFLDNLSDEDTGWWDDIGIIVLATPHTQYLDLPIMAKTCHMWRSGQYVLDAQGAWAKYEQFFIDQGIEYHQVGGRNWFTPNPLI